MTKTCALCKVPARTFCESDQATLCWDCDAKVHGANFLVARHSRTLLCHACQSPTPWKASGAKLGHTVSVCEACVSGARSRNGGGGGGDEEESGDNNDDLHEDDADEDGDEGDGADDDGGDDDGGDDGEGGHGGGRDGGDEDGDNQVVPWSSATPPPASSSSSSEESSLKDTEECGAVRMCSLKRMLGDYTEIRPQEENNPKCSSSGLPNRRSMSIQRTRSSDGVATSVDSLMRPLKDRRIGRGNYSVHGPPCLD